MPAKKSKSKLKKRTPAKKTSVRRTSAPRTMIPPRAATPRATAVSKPFVAKPAKSVITDDQIARRAYEIAMSGTGGSELDNWLRAERELRGA